MEEETKKTHEDKKQEIEQKREEKQKRIERAKTKKAFKQYGIWVLIIALVGFSVYLIANAPKPEEPEGEGFSVKYDIQGAQHITEGEDHPEYNSNPPSSGWHYARPARGGFYEEPLEDERVVHNLEHGDIWIAYHPDISESALETLESLAGPYVVVSPRAENEGDISLAAWGRVDTFNVDGGAVDEGRIQDFISRYDNRGPEKLR